MEAELICDEAPRLGKRYRRISEFHRYISAEREKARQSVLNVIKCGALVDVACLCGSSDGIVLATVDRWALPCREVLCPECGMLRVSPRWDDATYQRIYADHFWSLQTGSAALTHERFMMSVERSRAFSEALQRLTPLYGKSVVEIGCSYGAGLVRLLDLGVKSLVGYDWDEEILATGRRYSGCDLRRGGTATALADHPEGVDLVILRHVFEHLLDPLAETAMLRKLLAPGGVLFVEVPGVLNAQEWSPDPFGFFNAFHVYSYCLRTLTRVMERCGFTLVAGDEHLYSLWESIENPVVTPWNDKIAAKEVLSFIETRERKRRWRQSIVGRLGYGIRNVLGGMKR